jgi:hypothetical protein
MITKTALLKSMAIHPHFLYYAVSNVIERFEFPSENLFQQFDELLGKSTGFQWDDRNMDFASEFMLKHPNLEEDAARYRVFGLSTKNKGRYLQYLRFLVETALKAGYLEEAIHCTAGLRSLGLWHDHQP